MLSAGAYSCSSLYICCRRPHSAANPPTAIAAFDRYRTEHRLTPDRYIDPAPHYAGGVNNTTRYTRVGFSKFFYGSGYFWFMRHVGFIILYRNCEY